MSFDACINIIFATFITKNIPESCHPEFFDFFFYYYKCVSKMQSIVPSLTFALALNTFGIYCSCGTSVYLTTSLRDVLI